MYLLLLLLKLTSTLCCLVKTMHWNHALKNLTLTVFLCEKTPLHRQHCRLSICIHIDWLSQIQSETNTQRNLIERWAGLSILFWLWGEDANLMRLSLIAVATLFHPLLLSSNPCCLTHASCAHACTHKMVVWRKLCVCLRCYEPTNQGTDKAILGLRWIPCYAKNSWKPFGKWR